MQPSPWFVEVLSRSSRWHATAWLLGLGALALAVGVSLGLCWGEVRWGASQEDRTDQRLTHLVQSIELAAVRTGSGCAEALAQATAAGWLEQSRDGWGHPIHLRCYGDTLVVRSEGPNARVEDDDKVRVRQLSALGSREIAELERPR